ncbi:transglutaminase family protein [Glaciimonas immobilis]|uniref:Transglutaminase-like putative cysteine protease n=1 Tax=Glaciimonas immobilis TaxID=728004 RepID=A0A840RV56_9BURK|nr:DUF3488 and transglutaminase-like domain-containing protein [Glaciimonas immobilis]KAF3999858.1 DUF3488 domain-containing transglutaminase family protein [Glaciimonas immobilis]MBB5200339.1 transglutaminase-like putative cysteine protease [Glaciimonas immobilis]
MTESIDRPEIIKGAESIRKPHAAAHNLPNSATTAVATGLRRLTRLTRSTSAGHRSGTRFKNPFGTLPRDKSDTLFLLFACSMVLLPHIDHLPIWISITCALTLLWRATITWQGMRLPRPVLLLPLAFFALLAVYLNDRTMFGRDAGVKMLVLLLTFKLLEMRARRDVFVVLFLSFFLVLTTFFYSQSILTALLVIATIIVLLTAQISFQFTGVIPRLRQRLRMGSMVLMLAIPLTLVLFLLFPRIQGPLWGMPGDANGGRSGMSDSMAPGTISQLAMSEEIAFRVKFMDPAPAPAQRYWRGAVLTNFDGRTWTRRVQRQVQHQPSSSETDSSSSDSSSPDSSLLDPSPLNAPPKASIRQQITMEPSGQHWLFALEMPQFAPALETNPPSRSHINADRELLSDRPIGDRVRYDVTSEIDTDGNHFDLANDTFAALQQALTLPRGFNPRTIALAAKLRSETSGDSDMVNAVLQLFHNENFSYTLEPPLLGRDNVDEFLFSTRAGFCEHYASAFVVLMRAANIPARVVTGYQGGEINQVDGYMTVRQSDAHAWAEVWKEGVGWERVDPTAAVAPERIQKPLHQLLPRSYLGGLINLNPAQNSWWNKLPDIRANWEALGNNWNQWVLNYSPDRQKGLLQYFGIQQMSWQMLVGLMIGMGSLALAVVLLPLLLVRNKIDPLDKLYSLFCKRMVKYGMSRELHEGPLAYRERLCAAPSALKPQAKIAITLFLRSYEALRYGVNNGPDKITLKALKIQFKKLKPLLS